MGNILGDSKGPFGSWASRHSLWELGTHTYKSKLLIVMLGYSLNKELKIKNIFFIFIPYLVSIVELDRDPTGLN